MSDVEKFTKTATFLFPLLEIPKALFDCNIKDRFGRFQHSTRFLNAYLKDTNIDKYQDRDDCVFILIRNYRDVDFDTFYSTVTGFPNYIDDYDFNECLVLVFSVSRANKEDFNMIRNGNYSTISAVGKKLILANTFYSGKMFTLPLVLNKADVLKNSWEERLTFIGKDIYSPADLGDQEVWPILDMNKETLTREIVNKINQKKSFIPSEEF